MVDIITKVWKGEARAARFILYVPLLILSYLYSAGIALRDMMYGIGIMKTGESPIPVVSVGNITLGGTGKTPAVERLAVRLKEAGFRPAIITRGYKRRKKGIFAVDAKKHSPEDVGDEAYMLAGRTGLPVIVGADRARAIEEGMKRFDINITVLDDGFQTKSVRKDFEIVVVNAAGTGKNNALFPLGPYRERPERLKSADVILINGEVPDGTMKRYISGITQFRMKYRPVCLYNIKYDCSGHYNLLENRRVLAFSGLGNNESFFGYLKRMGANVVREVGFADHHYYTAGDLERLCSYKDAELMVTTEKDAVKIPRTELPELPENLFYLVIEAAIENEEELIGLLRKRFSGCTYGMLKN